MTCMECDDECWDTDEDTDEYIECSCCCHRGEVRG